MAAQRQPWAANGAPVGLFGGKWSSHPSWRFRAASTKGQGVIVGFKLRNKVVVVVATSLVRILSGSTRRAETPNANRQKEAEIKPSKGSLFSSDDFASAWALVGGQL